MGRGARGASLTRPDWRITRPATLTPWFLPQWLRPREGGVHGMAGFGAVWQGWQVSGIHLGAEGLSGDDLDKRASQGAPASLRSTVADLRQIANAAAMASNCNHRRGWIAVVAASVALAGCITASCRDQSEFVQIGAPTAEHDPRPSMADDDFTQLVSRAEAGDSVAADQALLYVSDRSDIYSAADRRRAAAVAARAGSPFGSQVHIENLVSAGDCDSARAALEVYVRRHPTGPELVGSRELIAGC